MWKTVGITLLVVVLLGGAGYWFLGPKNAAAETTAPALFATVSMDAIEEIVGATGEVAPEQESRLALETSGRVIDVLVEQGDIVQEGDLLLQLEDDALSDNVERARASLDTVQARLVQAQQPASAGQIAAAEASVAAAQANLNKLLAGPTNEELEQSKLKVDSARNSLWSAQAQRDATAGSRGASDAQVDQAEAQVLIAEVAVEQALVSQAQAQAPARDEDIAAARAQVDQAQASLAKLYEQPRAADIAVSEAQVRESELSLWQAQEALADVRLVAPFAGVVIRVDVNQGDWVSPNVPVIELASVDRLKLDVLLDQVDVALVAEGQAARITFDALPGEEIVGQVTHMAPAATQTSNGVAYEVEMTFDAGDLPIRLGMTAKVDIVVQRVEDALLTPNRAIGADRDAGRYTVNRITPLGTETVEIEIGLRDENYTQVLSGLKLGDALLLQTIAITDKAESILPCPLEQAMGE